MRIGLFVLFGLSPVLAAPGSDPDFASQIETFREHGSLNFLEKSHMVLYQGEKRISGFGDFATRQGWNYDFIAGRVDYGDRVKTDSCKYQGYDCYWVVLNGEKYHPENTDSISVDGIPGTPMEGVWRFRIETGKAVAYARTPFGSPDSVVLEGKGHSLATQKDRDKFKNNLRSVPEAFELWGADPLGALRYFNRAQPYDIVSDTAYEGLDEVDFPAKASMHAGIKGVYRVNLEKRISQNANDLMALGRLAELHCYQGEHPLAEGYLEKIQALQPNYFRLHLAKGACAENRKNRDEAISRYEDGMQTAPQYLVPQIAGLIRQQHQKAKDDSLYQELEGKTFFIEGGLGFGMPYAILGVGFSVGWRIQGFALSVAMAEGLAQSKGSAVPAIGIRLDLPGQKWIPYLGFWDYAVFNGKMRDQLRYIGGGCGLAWDIGQPLGFSLDLGVGLMHSPSYVAEEDAPGERTVVDDIWLPHFGFTYEF